MTKPKKSTKPKVRKATKAKAKPVQKKGAAKILVLRTCPPDLIARGKSNNIEWAFQYPRSGLVECPDWDPTPTCGHGLHGLAWGDGDWTLMSSEHDAVWMVIEVDAVDLVKIDDRKVKFRKGNVVFAGAKGTAIARVLAGAEAMTEAQRAAREWGEKCGHSSKAASSGNSSKAASSGDYSKAASSGHSSKAASSGNSSTAASSGDSSKAASSGNSSTAASSGNYSTAASSGNSSTAASSGDSSTAASSGNFSKAASSGHSGIAATIGHNGMAKAGPLGLVIVTYWVEKEKRYNACIGRVGENEIEADVWYRVVDGKLTKAGP